MEGHDQLTELADAISVERERRALLRRRPDVGSWRELLDAARRTYQTDIAEFAADYAVN